MGQIEVKTDRVICAGEEQARGEKRSGPRSEKRGIRAKETALSVKRGVNLKSHYNVNAGNKKKLQFSRHKSRYLYCMHAPLGSQPKN